MKRESKAPKRYMDEVFVELTPQRKKKVKPDRKLYPVIVTEVDKIGKRMKIHYVGYSEQFDEWRPCDTEAGNPPFQRLESLCVPSSTSILLTTVRKYAMRIISECRTEIFFLNTFKILLFMTAPRIPDSFKIFSVIRAIADSGFSSFAGSSEDCFERA